MNAAGASADLRARRLHALGISGWHWRGTRAPARPVTVAAPAAGVASARAATVEPIRRLALVAETAERSDPAIAKMYADLSEAVTKAGLQPVRVCDVAADPAAAVLVFGAAAVPTGVPPVRVLRADPLAVLHADRERKRALWRRLQALGRTGVG